MSNGKYCNSCNVFKSYGEFHRDRAASDGRKSTCKDCRHEHRVSTDAKISDAKYRVSDKGVTSAKKYRSKRDSGILARAKRLAHRAIQSAIEAGHMKSASSLKCADCGDDARDYHHESYEEEKWLDVEPLCRSCHMARHRQ